MPSTNDPQDIDSEEPIMLDIINVLFNLFSKGFNVAQTGSSYMQQKQH
ncbi:hypothetical protein [Nocardia sp. CDC160]|nr:hypothetical protein [Nocardia sp. CDC160]MEC3913466.1 hypothetical protein [Nocardia sp. CDC160]